MEDPSIAREEIDPDPFVIASLALASASTVLQLVQTYVSLRPSPPPSHDYQRDNQRTQVLALEESVGDAKRAFENMQRAVERGSSDPDGQFYDAPLRVAQTQLLLDGVNLDQLSGGIAQTSVKIAAISQWVTMIIKSSPDLAYRLGERMSVPLEKTADRLNEALASGAPIRQVIVENRFALESLANAIAEELRSN